jgi:hypothetical protein
MLLKMITHVKLFAQRPRFFRSGTGDGLLVPPWGMMKTKRVRRAPSMAA